jgi:hypothetical protein
LGLYTYITKTDFRGDLLHGGVIFLENYTYFMPPSAGAPAYAALRRGKASRSFVVSLTSLAWLYVEKFLRYLANF